MHQAGSATSGDSQAKAEAAAAASESNASSASSSSSSSSSSSKKWNGRIFGFVPPHIFGARKKDLDTKIKSCNSKLEEYQTKETQLIEKKEALAADSSKHKKIDSELSTIKGRIEDVRKKLEGLNKDKAENNKQITTDTQIREERQEVFANKETENEEADAVSTTTTSSSSDAIEAVPADAPAASSSDAVGDGGSKAEVISEGLPRETIVSDVTDDPPGSSDIVTAKEIRTDVILDDEEH